MQIEYQIWEDYRSDLYKFLLSRTKDSDLANDLVQDTLLKAFESRADLKDVTKLKSWLFTIARNKLIDTYRSTKNVEPYDLTKHDAMEGEEQPDSNMAECVSSLAKSLPEKYAQPLLMSDIQSIKQKDIADQLGLSLSGAKSRVQRGREMLKEKLFACCPLEFNSKGTAVACVSSCCQ